MEDNTLAQILELGTEELIQVAVSNNEGVIASNGALSLETGERTGRSPNDRFIVEEDSTSHLIDWGNINKPFDANKFSLLWDKVDAYLAEKDRYLSKVHVGAHEDHYIPVNVISESASHSLFSKLIFINPSEFNHQGKQEWQILSALNYQCARRWPPATLRARRPQPSPRPRRCSRRPGSTRSTPPARPQNRW